MERLPRSNRGWSARWIGRISSSAAHRRVLGRGRVSYHSTARCPLTCSTRMPLQPLPETSIPPDRPQFRRSQGLRDFAQSDFANATNLFVARSNSDGRRSRSTLNPDTIRPCRFCCCRRATSRRKRRHMPKRTPKSSTPKGSISAQRAIPRLRFDDVIRITGTISKGMKRTELTVH